MGIRDIYREYKANSKKTRASDYLPFEELYADGDILTKDWGLMRCFLVDYPDTSTSDAEADIVSDQVRDTFQGFSLFRSEGKASYWFVLQRVPRQLEIEPETSGAVNMAATDREIEDHRLSDFTDGQRNNENLTYACVKVSTMKFDGGGISLKSREMAEAVFREFESMLFTIGAHPVRLTTTAENPNANIMTFIKRMVGTGYEEFRCPANGMKKFSQFVSSRPIENGKPLKIGDTYVQALTINSYPSRTNSNMLVLLETLPFCFRWVTRWMPLTNWDSQQEAKKLRGQFKSGVKSWKTMFYESTTGNTSNTMEIQAVADVQDMEEVLGDLSQGETLGKFTSVIVLMADSIEELDRQKKIVKMTVQKCHFDYIEEGPEANLLAWLSTIPGDSVSNPRQPYITASNLSHIIPFTNVYHGSPYNEFMDQICGNGFPHVIGRLVTNELYYLNLNGSGDIGHCALFGATGSGKSVALSLFASQWMRYPNSRVILFDKDMSFEPICRSTGGSVYIPLGDDSDVQFMPLGRLNDPGHSDEALAWLECMMESQNIPYNPKTSADFDQLIQHWGNLPPTLEQFYLHLKGLNPESPALPAIRRIIDDPGLSRLFGGTVDSFSIRNFTRKTMIEMGPLMDRGTIALLPALQFMFSRMDELFDKDPKPTLLIMDEAWRFMSHPYFRKKIKEWLKTLRKKNVFVMFAFQNINDVDDVEEFLTSCHTRIFLPNPDASPTGSSIIREKYLSMGLKEGEVDIIGTATPKKHYYIQQDEGCALVDFCVDRFQLERITRRGF